jgi:hypothetical protein
VYSKIVSQYWLRNPEENCGNLNQDTLLPDLESNLESPDSGARVLMIHLRLSVLNVRENSLRLS